MDMYTYIYTRIYIHLCIHVYIYIYICTYMYTNISLGNHSRETWICFIVSADDASGALESVHPRPVHTHCQTRIKTTLIHSHTHMCAHTHAHTKHTHTHTHTNIHILSCTQEHDSHTHARAWERPKKQVNNKRETDLHKFQICLRNMTKKHT